MKLNVEAQRFFSLSFFSIIIEIIFGRNNISVNLNVLNNVHNEFKIPAPNSALSSLSQTQLLLLKIELKGRLTGYILYRYKQKAGKKGGRNG